MRIPPQLLLILLFALVGCPDGGDDDDVQGDDDDVQQDDDSGVGDDDLQDDDTTATDDDDSAPCDDPLDAVEVWRYESSDGEGTPGDCDELNVEILGSQEDFEARFEALFPITTSVQGIPTGIDFEENLLLLSHITFCDAVGYDLVVDWVCPDGWTLDVYATLWHPEIGWWPANSGKPLNLTTVPKGEYLAAEGHLSEVIPEEDE